MLAYVIALGLVVVLAYLAQSARRVPVGSAFEGDRMGHTTQVASGPARVFAFLASATLIAMAALRWRRGTDYVQYEISYTDYVAMPWSDMRLFGEPGIRVVAKIGEIFLDDPLAMFAVASLITVGLTTLTISRSTRYLPLALYLYVTSTAWQGSFNGVRQYLACAVVFAGHRLIIERRFWAYLAVVALASLFHISAWLLVLIYWLPRHRLGPLQVGLLLGGAILALNGYQYIGEVIDLVKDDDISSGTYFVESINPLRIAVALAPVALYVLLVDKTKLTERGFFYANVMYVHASILIASLNSAYVARFALYTGVFIAVAVPAMVEAVSPRARGLVTLLAVAGFGAFWYLETSAIGALNPYRWVGGE